MPNDIVKTSSDIENVDWSTGSGPHYANVVRFGSSSSQASQSSGDICRICHCEADPKNPLLTPCYCSGSLKYVHQTCLQQWLTASGTTSCELCKFPFIMHTKIKPFNEWRSLDMSGVERRRLCCSILFHCAAALCVIWSLCVLIERATQEVKNGEIGWPFWTKLAVVTVGLTGGIVFMYIQCRQYLHLCHRWRARNRILLIQNAPEKIRQLSQPSPVLHGRNIPQISNNVTSPATAMTANNSFNCNSYNYCAATVGACGASSAIVNLNSQNNNTQFVVGNNSSVSYQSVPQHGQIVANIENSSQAYDRDWTLDNVSQISSFRPCPQGSGSMTPFHDSVNNVIETNSRSSSNSVSGSRQDLNMSMPNSSNNHNNQTNLQQNTNTNRNLMNRTNDLDSFKPSTTNNNNNNNVMGVIPSASISLSSSNRYPNSSVFLENRDILNDTDYPKINYRHSSILTSPDITDNLDKFLGKDLRRYSDTKLLTNDDDILNPILNVEIHTNNDCNVENDKTIINIDECRNKTIDKPSVSETLFQNILGIRNVVMPQKITDIIFESATNLNPKIIELDKRQNSSRKKMRRSLNTVENDESFETEPNPPIDKNRMYFKSLPNLSSSCESLIKK